MSWGHSLSDGMIYIYFIFLLLLALGVQYAKVTDLIYISHGMVIYKGKVDFFSAHFTLIIDILLPTENYQKT